MLRVLRFGLILLLIFFSVGAALSQSAEDDAELHLGVQAFKTAHYDEAVQHFHNVVNRDPQNVKARQYLATAYSQQFIPGALTPDNLQLGQLAIDQYRAIIEIAPSDQNAVKGIAYLYLQMKKFDDAKAYYARASDLDPKDPEPLYTMAVMDWTQAYQPRMETRAKLGLGPEKRLIDQAECAQIREANEPIVADGIDKLNRALQLRPDYDDAMAYMNLMYRERADIQCGDPQAYAADIRKADKWVDLTISAKKAKPRPATRVDGGRTVQ